MEFSAIKVLLLTLMKFVFQILPFKDFLNKMKKKTQKDISLINTKTTTEKQQFTNITWETTD